MNPHIGKRCPYCNSVFKEDDHIVVCSICDMPHHFECWQDNQGCSTFGCTGLIKEMIGTPQQPQAFAQGQGNGYAPPRQPAVPQKAIKRFEEIKKSEEKLLYPEARVILSGYTMIRDNNSNGDVFVRFRFGQYTDKILMALLADVRCTDPWGNETERIEDVQFLDLHANRTTEFGQTVPVKLTNPNARDVQITIKSLIYSDNTKLSVSDTGEPILPSQSLEEKLGSKDLVSQFKRETSNMAASVPVEQKTMRRCCCGACFDASVSICPVCNTDFNASAALLKDGLLQEKLNAFQAAEAEKARIKKEREEETQRRLEEAQRLSDERARKELEEKEKAEAEEKARKNRLIKRAVAISASALAVVGLTLASVLYFIPQLRYEIAVGNLEKGNYDKAIAAFTSLGDVNDSAELVKEAKYKKALSLMVDKKYAEAKSLFEEIKGYEDSDAKATKCDVENTYLLALKDFEDKKYEEAAKKFDSINNNKYESKEYSKKSHYLFAKELFDKKNYKDAEVHFSSAGSYEDAAEKLKECRYLYGLECFEKKNYREAYNYLTKVKTYKDVPEKYDEVCYQYGLTQISAKSWDTAISVFNGLGDYSDSKEKELENLWNNLCNELSSTPASIESVEAYGYAA